MSAVGGGIALLGAACSNPEAREQAEQAAARQAIAAAESTVTRVAALPATGLWSEAHLMERLVRTGVLPRPLEGRVPAAPWMGQAPIALSAGGGEVFAWIYADSSARKAVTDALDPDTGAPRGSVSPWAIPMQVVINNNLVAIVTGGSERNQERIALALQAGLPVSP